MTNFSDWIAKTTGGASARAIATAVGISHPTVRKNIDNADPAFALTVAEHYNANPVDALVAAGAITDDQVTRYAKDNGFGVDDYTDLELAQLIVDRLAAAENADASPLATVTEFPLPDSNTSDLDIDPGIYAADDSDTEPEPGDDDYHDGP
ncbi:hypothetical protein [Corynebacterium lujinxingii]|uniref:DNA-binding protein n=1 Tax=Corynebacterium lujinxingii TaxID=2763010 RepID=A0A7H0JWQ8_9CORY|nr:hypothetical protein [Corynebacterium lujinxingii]MBC3178112.1 hypothetical protein [Corynebacterium lujinxingii]NNO09647.1 hypothetical protein [Corynebacterium lujinxingii]QNP89474.1 hypothetical protein IAU68_07110 [Corynebacterium lujinxingii]